jgi:biotin carboxyl carrier protein
VTTTATVVEGGVTRVFRITLEGVPASPTPGAAPTAIVASAPPAAPVPGAAQVPGANGSGGFAVTSPFGGTVEVLAITVRQGDHVVAGQVVATVEAMKAEHEVRSPEPGTVEAVHARPGDEVTARQPILTLRR